MGMGLGKCTRNGIGDMQWECDWRYAMVFEIQMVLTMN